MIYQGSNYLENKKDKMETELYSYLRRFDSIEEAEDFLRNRCEIPHYYKLNDDTFPKFVEANIGWITCDYLDGGLDVDEWNEMLLCDIDKAASESLINSPFLLWSDKLQTCFAHIEGCSEKGDEQDFEECFIQLIKAYDIPKIVSDTVKSMLKRKHEIIANIKYFWDGLAEFENENLEKIRIDGLLRLET